MYASDPTGVPRMVSPCSWGGKCWLPAQTSGPRGSKPGGVVPLPFQTRVFPLLSWMWACWKSSWAMRS